MFIFFPHFLCTGVCLHVCLTTMYVQCSWRVEEGISSHRGWNWTWVLYNWMISPVLYHVTYVQPQYITQTEGGGRPELRLGCLSQSQPLSLHLELSGSSRLAGHWAWDPLVSTRKTGVGYSSKLLHPACKWMVRICASPSEPSPQPGYKVFCDI